MPGSPTAPILPENLEFLRALWAVVHGLERTSKRMYGEIGVTGPQRLALRLIGLRPGLSAGDLADALYVHPSTLTGILHRLEEQGLLTRVAAEGDRRRAVLRLTPRGARIDSGRTGTVESVVGATLRAVGDRERTATRRVLATLATRLEASARRRG